MLVPGLDALAGCGDQGEPGDLLQSHAIGKCLSCRKVLPGVRTCQSSVAKRETDREVAEIARMELERVFANAEMTEMC